MSDYFVLPPSQGGPLCVEMGAWQYLAVVDCVVECPVERNLEHRVWAHLLPS